jgi:hypothetical protein
LKRGAARQSVCEALPDDTLDWDLAARGVIETAPAHLGDDQIRWVYNSASNFPERTKLTKEMGKLARRI